MTLPVAHRHPGMRLGTAAPFIITALLLTAFAAGVPLVGCFFARLDGVFAREAVGAR